MSHRRDRSLRNGAATALTCLHLALASMAASAQPSSAPSLTEQMSQARELAINGQREAALQLYDRLLTENPDHGDLLLARGRTLAWMGRWEESERDLRAVTAAHPSYGDAWSALGDMYFWNDRAGQAAQAYAQWAAVKPNDPEPRIAQGRALRDAGDKEAALRAFEHAGQLGAPRAEVDDLVATLQRPPNNPGDWVPEQFRWVASVSYDHTGFEGGRVPWNDYSASLRRRFESGSLALELLRANHFGTSDHAIALDGYVDLWSRAYANIRYQHASGDRLFPHYAARAELFQGVGSGWELSGSYDRLKFSDDVNIYGVGVGRYFGNYYARLRVIHVPGNDGSNSTGYRALLRNYYAGDSDTYLEFRIGHGRGNDFLPGRGMSAVSNQSVGISWVRFPEPHWGFKIAADYGRDSVAPNQLSVSASIYRRW